MQATLEAQPLRITDRCDRCGAQAQVRVEIMLINHDGRSRLVDWDLMFCGHHYRDHEELITLRGYRVTDERWRLEAAEAGTAV